MSLLAAKGPNGSESPLVELPAHRVGWVPPAEYHRSPFALPGHVDTRTALVTAVNALRRKLGRKPLHLAAEQSNFMQTAYEQAFKLNAGGDWLGDNQIRELMLRGDHVKGAVLGARIASGIAFDGDAGDWLAYRMLFPVSRDTLMAADIDEIAIATHGDAAVGFGAAAVVYALLTPEVEASMAAELAEALEQRRKGRPTQLMKNPPELMVAASEVARGNRSLDALSAALMGVNLSASPRYLKGFVLPLDDNESAESLLGPLLAAKTLAYGIVITHLTDPNSGRARPIAFVWFIADRPTERQAMRDARQSIDTHTRGAEL